MRKTRNYQILLLNLILFEPSALAVSQQITKHIRHFFYMPTSWQPVFLLHLVLIQKSYLVTLIDYEQEFDSVKVTGSSQSLELKPFSNSDIKYQKVRKLP